MASESEIIANVIGRAKEDLRQQSGSADTDNHGLAAAVRLYRAGKNITLKALADASELLVEDVWAIESGRLTDPGDERVKALSAVVGLSENSNR